jgi:hypothetical protein
MSRTSRIFGELATSLLGCAWVNQRSPAWGLMRVILPALSMFTQPQRGLASVLVVVVRTTDDHTRSNVLSNQNSPPLVPDSPLGLTGFQLTCYNGFS